MLTMHGVIAATAMLALTTTVDVTLPAKTVPGNVEGCAAAEHWVNENQNRLPTTYEDFAKYQVTYRSMIYTKLSLKTRAAFWQAHLAHFMAAHDLNPAQTALIQEVRGNIVEYLAPNAYMKDSLMLTRARRVLGERFTKDALMNLVPLSPTDLIGEACSCSTVNGSCPAGFGCKDMGCTPVACGFLGHDTCNGTCNSPE